LQRLNKLKGKKEKFLIKSKGNSMFPLLQNDDVVEYRRCAFKSIKENDIVLIHTGDVFMTHRVIYKNASRCITRGDNNSTSDNPLKKDQIFARAIRFKRKGKWYGIQDVYLSQSILYLHEINKLKNELDTRLVAHVFLKGVLVALRYENSIPKRVYADCDLLVKREDIKKIDNAFRALGYAYIGKTLYFSSIQGSTDQPEINYMKIVNGVPVIFDVHFDPVFLMTQVPGKNFLYNSKLLNELRNEIFQNAKRTTIKGTKYPLCGIEDQILYLALHIFHHNLTDIVRYRLLDSVIKKSGASINWKRLGKTIRKFRLEGYVYIVFIFLKKYYDTKFSASFIRSICPSERKKRILLWYAEKINIFDQDIPFIPHHNESQFSKFFQKLNIFGQDARLRAAVIRFTLIFILSPEPILKRLCIFINPETVLFALRAFWAKTRLFLFPRVREKQPKNNIKPLTFPL